MKTGLIPVSLGKLTNLTELNLHGNQLSGKKQWSADHLSALAVLATFVYCNSPVCVDRQYTRESRSAHQPHFFSFGWKSAER